MMSLNDASVSQISTDSDSSQKQSQFILFSVIPASFRASSMLKEGDKAQRVTLKLLEKTQTYMDKPLHNRLHQRYDGLKEGRLSIKRGFFARGKQWDEIVVYRKGSVELSDFTVVSSEIARSKQMWNNKFRESSPAQASHLSPSNSASQPDYAFARSALADAVPTNSANQDGVNNISGSSVGPVHELEEDDTTRPSEYGICELDSKGFLINSDKASVLTDIELQKMVERGDIEFTSEPAEDDSESNPFADSGEVAGQMTGA
ncbi:uncharacterized protein B0H18DRAFT_612659 [Fomitopsis serialis]|uniref:uncharacterized protein n=1 Tax=Fomitopsis serialis TaxID=139415 RepID=UPI00200866F5|nr:uncharacterized protein B0H18DRAFT_612659 [Neoantrodia serialis]KAH9920131.1 hypothetical protein B0H18DRAFT_612659 [Neoantrodia serialis]